MIVANVTPAVVARHYDELDAFYRDVWGSHLHHGFWRTGRETPEAAVEALVEEVAEAAGIRNARRVCDVGCGYGGTARLLAERFDAEVVGFTVSEAQYRFARDATAPAENPRYELCRWEENALPDASRDAIVSIECVSHVADKPAFFRQVNRVLRPGGRVAMTAWLAEPKPSRWRRRHLLEPICREGRLAGLASAAEYLAWAEAAGLRCERSEDWSPRVNRTWAVCGRRLLWRLLTRGAYRRALFDRGNSSRMFAITLFRIRLAYKLGSMQYGCFVFSKPSGTGGGS